MRNSPINSRHLSPEVFYDAPELATLDVLRGVLDIAMAVVLTANPELDTEELLEGRIMLPAQTWLADAFLREADALRATLDRYCHAAEAQPVLGALHHDQDLPF